MKTATIFLFGKWIPRELLDAKLVLHMHDEFQAEVNPEHVERYCELAKMAFVKAGEYFELNIPMEGDPIVGTSWAETH